MSPDFKSRLRAGRPALCCLLNMASPVAAEIVACAGYDSAMVDLEHGPGDIPTTLLQLQALAARGCAGLVRVPANDPVWLKRVLDLGPAGVMVPMVADPAAAEAAVAACRYPPRGVRGVAHPIARAAAYGAERAAYVERGEADLLLICQIESPEAVGRAAAIAAVEGVDMLFVGPMDLSAAAGHFDQPDAPALAPLIAEVRRAAKAAGKLFGLLATPGRPAARLLAEGTDLVIDAVDVSLLREAAAARLAAARPESGPAAG